MLAKWFRLKSWIRFTVVVTGLLSVGFALDLADHAFGWKPLPSIFTLPCVAVVAMLVLDDRRKKKP